MGHRPASLRRTTLALGAALVGVVAVAHADELKQFLHKGHKKSASSTSAPASDPAADPAPPAATKAAAPASLDDDPPPPAAAPRTRTVDVAKPREENPRVVVPDGAPGVERGPAGAARVPPGPIGRPGDRRAILALSVNMVDKGTIFVVLRGHDVLALVGDLEDAGLHGFTGLREAIGGKPHVSLASLASSGVTFELDERALALRVSAPAADLGRSIIDLRPPRPTGVLTSDEGSGFINYTARLTDFRHPSGFAEAGATYKNGLLYGQATATIDGRFVRGLTNLQYAMPERMQRFIAGDTFATTGLLGGGLILGGLSAVRDFNLDPYFYRFPSAGLGGAVMTPSTVDVYVNGALVRRQEIAPGPFQIDNLPLPVGANNARIVVRDAFGREQVVATPFYFSTGVLRPGVSDFGFHGGFRRNDMAVESWNYAPAVFLGRYRFGLTDSLTPGARVEGSRGLLSGGPQATLRTPLGDLEGAAAGSYDGASGGYGTGAGAAGSLSFSALRSLLSAGALLRANTAHYVNLSLPANQDRPLGQADVFAGAQVGSRVSVTGRLGLARYRDAGDSSQVGLLANVRVHEAATVFVTGTRTQAETLTKPLYEIFATVVVALPDRATASAYYDQQNGSASGGADLQRSLPLGPGYGYRLHASTGSVTDLSGTAQAQSAYGRYEATFERLAGHDTTTLTASGGLVTLGGHVFATRPVQQGFGLIEVPGVAGVRGYVNNQEVGRTDGDGNLLVPEMIPYYANRLGIADEDLPLDYRLDDTERLVAPPMLGGTTARFGVERQRAVSGRVVLNVGGSDVAPSYGEIVVKVGTEERTSPLGRGGEFFFEDLGAGTYAAELDSAAGACKLDLVVPGGDKAVVDLGPVRCIGRVIPGMTAPGGVVPVPAAPIEGGK
ncbi:MAG TPA: fimbria/pilus outer membrane usher protein [Polyangia bacterium]|nr:fimbria/pilus outer membrane usher protein [Polyangia bacterium]